MLIDISGSPYLFAQIQSYKKIDLTISFYVKAAGDIFFLRWTMAHPFDLGIEINFAIPKILYDDNENRINALFSGTSLFLLEEKELNSEKS